MMLSSHVAAYDLNYSVNLTTTYVEDSSVFGGISVGDSFGGLLAADSTSLAAQVDFFGSTDIATNDPTDGIDFMFDFGINGYHYSYAFDPLRDYIANPDYGFAETTFFVNNDALSFSPAMVTDILGFHLLQPGDANSYGLEIGVDPGTGTGIWHAYDDSTGYGASGTVAFSRVPEPQTYLLILVGVTGLLSFRKKQVAS